MQGGAFVFFRLSRVAWLFVFVVAVGFALASTASAFAAAPDGFTSQTYQDNNGDGAIDRAVVVINGGEALTACVVTDAEVATDWTYVGGATFGGSLTTTGDQHTCAGATATLVIQSTTVMTTGGTAPTIAYDNDDGDSSIANASGSLGTVAAQNLADGAGPLIKTFTYQDADADGKIDRITVTYTESTAAGSVLKASHLSLTNVGDFTGAAFGSATTDVADGGTSDVVDLGTEATVRDTAEGSGLIAISTITGDGTMSISDGTTTYTQAKAQNQASFADGAAPVIGGVAYEDTNSDARVDRVRIGYTETVTAASVISQNDLLFTSVGDFTAATFGTASTDLITSSVTQTLVPFSVQSIALDTNDGSGVFGITTRNTFSLTDGTNTNATLAAQTQAAINDGARPMLLSSSPSDGAADVARTASVSLTFSEAVTSVTWTHTGGPAVTSFTASGTSTVTLSHSELLSSGYHAIDITAAPDAGTNLYNGAVAAAADPFTFTVAGSSSAGNTVQNDAEVGVTVTAPNGGEALVPGGFATVTWNVTGTNASAMSAANIILLVSANGATTEQTIVTNTPNDGSYSWTVPNSTTANARIRVEGTDLVDILAADESDAYFTIGTPTAANTETDTTTTAPEVVTAPSTGSSGPSPVTGKQEDVSVVHYGDYVRSATFDIVYFIDKDTSGNLIRRPFTNAQIFATWASNRDSVVTVTDATLPTITLGEPMLPQPGTVLLRIQPDPRVYAIANNGVLRWITTEHVASSMFGLSWQSYILDLAPTLVRHLIFGDDITQPEDVNIGALKTQTELQAK